MDERDDPCEPKPRIHAYDHQGVRVSCLPAVHEAAKHVCVCGHPVIAASAIALLESIDDHVDYLRVYGQHA